MKKIVNYIRKLERYRDQAAGEGERIEDAMRIEFLQYVRNLRRVVQASDERRMVREEINHASGVIVGAIAGEDKSQGNQ